jgi:hypothetical protein
MPCPLAVRLVVFSVFLWGGVSLLSVGLSVLGVLASVALSARLLSLVGISSGAVLASVLVASSVPVVGAESTPVYLYQ